MSLPDLVCDVEDFCSQVGRQQPRALPAHFGQRVCQAGLWPSEIMTIVIHFHQSGYRCFKDYYQQVVLGQLRSAFPRAVSYARFVRLIVRVVMLLWGYAQSRRGRCTGLSFVDSTALDVCHNRRIGRHRVLAGIAKRGRAGCMASNCIGWSMTRAMCWPFACPLAMSMTERPCRAWSLC